MPNCNIQTIHVIFAINIFLTVLCLWVTYFRRGAKPEICGYFNVQIWVRNEVKSERYMGIEAYACVSTVPDDVCIPNQTNSVRSRSGPNCFSNRCTRTRHKNYIMASAPKAPFPGAKHDHIWSLGHLMSQRRAQVQLIGQTDFAPTS